MRILTTIITALLLMQSTGRSEEPWRFLTLADWHIAEVYVHPNEYPEMMEEISAGLKMLKANYGGELVMLPGDSNKGHWDTPAFIKTPEHPVCAGLPEVITLEDDETYWPPTPLMEGVTVLATSVEEKAKRKRTPRAAQPMFWCCEPGAGHVFGCVPGHCAQTFDDPVFRKLLLRGIAWSAGESPMRFAESSTK